MKSLIKTLLIVLTLFCLTGCGKEFDVEEVKIEQNEVIYEDLKSGTNFSVSFWIKPIANHFDTQICTIEFSDNKLYLLNDSYDENYVTRGINLSHDNGFVYKDSSCYLETYRNNFVVVDYKNNTLSLYLNGELVDEESFFKKFWVKDLRIKFGSEKANFILNDLHVGDSLSSDEISQMYQNNISKRVDDIKPNVVGDIVIMPKDERIINYEYDENVFEKNGENLKIKDISNSGNIKFHCVVDGLEFGHEVEIKVDNSAEKNVKSVIESFGSVLYEKDKLPISLNEYSINYEVIEGRAEFDSTNNCLLKLDDSQERENIKLRVSTSKYEDKYEEEVDIVLLDPKYGQVLATFDGSDGWPEHVVGEESIYLFLGKDLKDWKKLNNNKIIETEDGSNRFRDPHLSRDADGNFIIVSTEGYFNPEFYVVNSKDLIEFNVKEISANKRDKTIDNEALITWAPECFYDRNNDQYVIHYSESGEKANSIYAVTTKDFENYSYPFILFDASYPVIDSNLTFINGKYYLFYKDETDGSKKIQLATSENLYNNNWDIFENFEYNFYGYDQEGPFVYKDGEDYFLFADAYRDGFVSYGEFHDNCYDWWIPEENNELNKLGVIRHFSIIDVTEKEYRRLEEYYRR